MATFSSFIVRVIIYLSTITTLHSLFFAMSLSKRHQQSPGNCAATFENTGRQYLQNMITAYETTHNGCRMRLITSQTSQTSTTYKDRYNMEQQTAGVSLHHHHHKPAKTFGIIACVKNIFSHMRILPLHIQCRQLFSKIKQNQPQNIQKEPMLVHMYSNKKDCRGYNHETRM